ncbi:hypothetical protein BOX15_Mlig033391g1 [Macrostomum lignano]|uniref:BTB domain-containing protein n=1 Tax=Macrostomum lignano TaxID=282301 RepID=A0A267GRM1_9PLAT|nr:hypothetical protein BOX15_Mlig033391g1 [Macrostomum lignano]
MEQTQQLQPHQQQQRPNQETMMILNMRGERMYFPKSVLNNERYTGLRQMLDENKITEWPNNESYYDLDPTVFRLLLNYYRHGNMHLPTYLCGPLLEKELQSWNVRITPDRLESCCMHTAMDSKYWKVLLDDFEKNALADPEEDELPETKKSTLHRLWPLLNQPCSSIPAIIYATLMVLCSIASAVMYTKDPPHQCSDWGHRGALTANCTLPNGSLDEAARSDFAYVICQSAFTLLFTVDLMLRALLTPNRAVFVRSPHTWNDVVSLVPLYGFLLYRMTGSRLDLRSPVGWLFELLSVALFFRVFRIIRHFMGIRVLAYTLLNGLSDLLMVVLLVFTATFLFGTIFFLMERADKENQDKVPTMFHGYYWAVITITTVGYGDITPNTVEGRVLAILCSLVGLIVVAVTVPIVSESFQRYYGHTSHLSVRGEVGKFAFKAKKSVKRAKNWLYHSGF